MTLHMTRSKQYTSAVCMAVGLVVAAAMPAIAQQPTDTTTTSRPMNGSGPSGRLEQYHGAFRASELVGATVYNDRGNSVGKVNDVLLDASGKADKVVISVGGFLGIDTKYIDVGFHELKIEPNHNSSADTTNTSAIPSTSSTASTPTGASSASRPSSAMAPGSATNTAANTSDSERYYSVVMPGATKESLAKMPEFKYSS